MYRVTVSVDEPSWARGISRLYGHRVAHYWRQVHHADRVAATSPRAAVQDVLQSHPSPTGALWSVQDRDLPGWPTVAYYRIDKLGRVCIARPV